MITIDKTKKEILFIPDKTQGEHPPERSFPLLSAYICPFCKKILAAYFQGQMPEADIKYYRQGKPEHTFGNVPGGHYVKIAYHVGYHNDSDKCLWQEFTKRGIVENLRQFVQVHNVPLLLVRQLSEKLGSIPGFCAVQDLCGRDREMLLFSEDALLGKIREKEGFDTYWQAKMNMGEHLMKVLRAG